MMASRGRQIRAKESPRLSFVLSLKMEASIAAVCNVTNIAQCILELVSNSLNAGATAIAIRIHREECKIQVIDNGEGMAKKDLKTVAEFETKWFNNCCSIEDICNRKALVSIRKLSDTLIISSKCYNSSKTYMKVFKVYQKPKIVKVQTRPSQGTTVSIYGFHELSLKKWDVAFMYKLIANIAIANILVSFTVRDDDEMKVTMIITKARNPLNIFKLLYKKEMLLRKMWYIRSVENHNMKFCIYIGLSNVKLSATQHIFLNNKIVHCPLILQIVSATFINALKFFQREAYEHIPKEEAVFILLFIWCKEYIFTVENGKKTLILPEVQCLLHDIRNQIIHVFAENIVPLSVNRSSREYRNLVTHHRNKMKTLKLYRSILPLQKFLSPQSNYTYHTLCHTTIRKKVTKITLHSQKEYKGNTMSTPKNVIELFTPTLQTNKINKEINTLTISEWSNWSTPKNVSHNLNSVPYSCNANQFHNNSLQFDKRFDFLPEKLHKQLRGPRTKLTKTDVLNECTGSVLSNKLKFGLKIPDILPHQEVDVRPCKPTRQFHEFILKRMDLKFIKVLGQINNELIVGLLRHNNIKILLLMDQHAIHERIRYEHLLNKYKAQIRNGLYSVKLKCPIVIQLSANNCNLVQSNEMALQKFGITFNVLNNDIIMIRTVPECLRKNKYRCDELKLTLNIKNLLRDLLQSITSSGYLQINNLPLTIHNAIAMEACHGAIKFGEPLTLKECRWLLKLLNETKSPTRCAHGRPSMTPLLELTDLRKRQKTIIKEKLNFGALKLERIKKV